MGIKMDKARCNGENITISTYDKKKHNNLNCRYCTAIVSFVSAHTKSCGNKNIKINSHFRLRQGNEHEVNCRYTVDGALHDIYARHADREYLTKSDNQYIVRLLGISYDDNKSPHISNYDTTVGEEKPRLNFIASGKTTAYLSTIRSIIKLRSKLEDGDELKDKVILKFYDEHNNLMPIPWHDFYFDTTDRQIQKDLYNKLKSSIITHPLCICGVIDRVYFFKDSTFCIQLTKIDITRSEKTVVEIYTNERISKMYENHLGEKIAVYAIFKTKDKTWKANDETIITYHNIDANIYDNRQIIFDNQD